MSERASECVLTRMLLDEIQQVDTLVAHTQSKVYYAAREDLLGEGHSFG